jgi:uncharacterized protein YhfF
MAIQQEWRALEAFAFGDGPAMADELLSLVLSGRKTATCWDATQGVKGSAAGKCYVVLDGRGQPRAIIQSMELIQRLFEDVDAGFARDEGEGDLSLDSWRRGHRDYFEREGGFKPGMMLWCERFRLVETIGEGAEQ